MLVSICKPTGSPGHVLYHWLFNPNCNVLQRIRITAGPAVIMLGSPMKFSSYGEEAHNQHAHP